MEGGDDIYWLGSLVGVVATPKVEVVVDSCVRVRFFFF